MKNRAIIKKSIIIRNVIASILLVLVLVISLTGATYAWFIASSSTPENVFTAGTVELISPEVIRIETETDPGSNFAFIPNSSEATVSKVDLLNLVEVEKYSTINPGTGTPYSPADYRVARMALDRNGNAWVLNTMTGSNSSFDFNIAQGSVIRISENGDTYYSTLGFPGDGPRTIVMTDEGEGDDIYFWVGFYLGRYFQKYHYNGNSLEEVPGAYIYLDNYTPYNAVLDAQGYMWVVSRHARPFPEIDGTPGVLRFNTNNVAAGYDDELTYNEPGNNPYSIMIDNNGDVWVSSGGPWGPDQDRRFVVYNGSDGSHTDIPIGLEVPAMRGFLQSSDGTIWATTVDGRLIQGSYDSDNWQFMVAYSGLGELTGLGFDAQGLLWVVSYGHNKLYGFDTENIGAGYGSREIVVGSGPYAYDSFTRPGRTCKTVEWEFEVVGTKRVYVRVKPVAQLNGSPLNNINLHSNSSNWQHGSDGWWYYGSASAPHEVYPNAIKDSKVSVVFDHCFANVADPNITVSLTAEAVQSSNIAIDHEWVLHPWVD